MNDDLERLVERSLGERAERLNASVGSIDDVLGRAERRQQRRRASAVVGSLAIIAVGFFGLSVVQGADEPVGRADAPVTAPATTVALSIVDGHQDAYRCEHPLDVTTSADDGGAYYAVCEHVLLIDGQPVDLVPTTVLQVPTTWPACEPVATSDVAVITAPCGTVPHSTIAYCEETDSGVTVTVPCPAHTIPPGPTAPATTVPCVVLEDGTESCSSTTSLVPATATTMVWAISESEQEHIVEPGDNLAKIADRYHIDVELLVNYNEWPDGEMHLLLPDDRVMIPPGAAIPNS